MNSAAALVVAGVTLSLSEGVERARASIDSGAAQDKLSKVAALSHSLDA